MNNKKKPDAFEPSKSRSGLAGKTFLSSMSNRISNETPKGKSNNCYKELTISRDREKLLLLHQNYISKTGENQTKASRNAKKLTKLRTQENKYRFT